MCVYVCVCLRLITHKRTIYAQMRSMNGVLSGGDGGGSECTCYIANHTIYFTSSLQDRLRNAT